jgi:glycosyltransferase involved in cell wall biosynthesis
MLRIETTPITVLIPAHNAERYVGQAIQSVIHQTYPHFEIVVVDDGSTDNTAHIVRSFCENDERVKLLQLPKSGTSNALNAGLSAAQGTYIARLDADDLCMPHRLQVQLDYLEHNPKIKLLGSHAYAIDHDGDPVKPLYVALDHHTIEEILLRETQIRGKQYFVTPSVIFEAELARRIGGFDPKHDFVEDRDFSYRNLLQKLQNGI